MNQERTQETLSVQHLQQHYNPAAGGCLVSIPGQILETPVELVSGLAQGTGHYGNQMEMQLISIQKIQNGKQTSNKLRVNIHKDVISKRKPNSRKEGSIQEFKPVNVSLSEE